jgi:hypothetical protein
LNIRRASVDYSRDTQHVDDVLQLRLKLFVVLSSELAAINIQCQVNNAVNWRRHVLLATFNIHYKPGSTTQQTTGIVTSTITGSRPLSIDHQANHDSSANSSHRSCQRLNTLN